jgi:simple sugar transport system substrate-binding protein
MAPEVSRRTLIRTAAMGLAGATLNVGAFGRALAAADLTVGVVYVGARDDFGWNQAHAVAIKALKEVPGVKVVEEENVPETDAVSKSMESMINLDGAALILATSFGYYTPFVVDLAKKYPDVQFRHAAPLWNKDKDPKNAGSYFGYLNQAHYVDGVAAGLSTKTNKIGFVAAKPIASVLSNISARARPIPRRRCRSFSPATGRCRCARPKPPTPWSTPAATSSPAMSTDRRW